MAVTIQFDPELSVLEGYRGAEVQKFARSLFQQDSDQRAALMLDLESALAASTTKADTHVLLCMRQGLREVDALIRAKRLIGKVSRS